MKKALFNVAKVGEMPLSFMAAIHETTQMNAIRIAGGCKKMEPQQEDAVRQFFRDGFKGYEGIIFSGATQSITNGVRDFMVTELPVLIAEGNPNVKVLGSTPRTSQMTLAGENSSLFLDTYGQQIDARYDNVTLVQQSVNDVLGWDGDLELYFEAMNAWRDVGANTAVITFNGGDVTYKEAKVALETGHALIIVNGSGRKSDELAAELAGTPNVYIVEAGNAESLRSVLQELNLLSAVPA